MYIKNRRNGNKIKAFGLNQAFCLYESYVLRNPLLFIYRTVMGKLTKTKTKDGMRKPSG